MPGVFGIATASASLLAALVLAVKANRSQRSTEDDPQKTLNEFSM